MGFLASIVSWITSGALSGLMAPILGYFTAKNDANLEGFKTAATTDAAIAVPYLNAQVEMAQIQATTNMWWGARLIILLAAGSASIHLAGVMLDSTPLFHHVVGSWGVAALPQPYADHEWDLLKSFFIMTPVAPVLGAINSWLHRK